MRRGVIRDFKTILADKWDENKWNKSDFIYEYNSFVTFEFFSADRSDKLRGAGRDYLFINEVNNITLASFNELDVRTRICTFVDYNPTQMFWIQKFITSKNFIKSTYLDSKAVLQQAIVDKIESRRGDKNWFRVYGLGEIGSTEGLVFPDFIIIDKFPEHETEKCFYGLDFGFSSDPSALSKLLVKGDNLYAHELLYQTNLTNQQLARRFEQLGVSKNYDEIYCDSAEPKSIEELKREGYNARPALKGPDSVIAGIRKLQEYKINVTKDSTNLIKELRGLQYQETGEDAEGNKLFGQKLVGDDHLCFGKNTKVMTSKGNKRISKIKIGDLVLTRWGYRPVTNVMSRISETYNWGGTIVTGNHPIITSNGKISVLELTHLDIILKLSRESICQKSKKLLSTMAKSMAGTLEEKKAHILEAMGSWANVHISIETNGLMRKVQYLKGLTYIILTRTQVTMISIILNLLVHMNTGHITLKKTIKQTKEDKNIGKSAINLQQNGTNQKKVEQKQKKFMLETEVKSGIDVVSLISSVLRVVKNTYTQILQVNNNKNLHQDYTAQMPARLNTDGSLVNMMRPENANDVEQTSWLINTTKQDIVVKSVLANINIIPARKSKVYNITVQEHHEYFANNVLVANCDSIRYGIFTKYHKPGIDYSKFTKW